MFPSVHFFYFSVQSVLCYGIRRRALKGWLTRSLAVLHRDLLLNIIVRRCIGIDTIVPCFTGCTGTQLLHCDRYHSTDRQTDGQTWNPVGGGVGVLFPLWYVTETFTSTRLLIDKQHRISLSLLLFSFRCQLLQRETFWSLYDPWNQTIWLPAKDEKHSHERAPEPSIVTDRSAVGC